VDLLEQVPVPVEECAVDAGVPGDAADGDFPAVAGGVPEGFEDAFTATGGVGSSAGCHCCGL